MNFLNCLFDEGEATCFSISPKGTDIHSVDTIPSTRDAFFSINPIALGKDNMPVEQWHKETIGRRADCNVTSFRNFLVEMDKMPLEQQDQYISEIGMPYSTAVYSGGKSIHYIISLETPLSGAPKYKKTVERIYRAVGKNYVDISNKNPSRLSRLPGHIRLDTGKEQKLLAVKGRVPNSVLEEWLVSRGADVLPESDWETVPRRKGHPKDFSNLFPSTRNFLMSGVQENWNLSLFKAAADLARNGWPIDEGTEELMKVTGTLDGNDMKTIRSAYRNEENQ